LTLQVSNPLFEDQQSTDTGQRQPVVCEADDSFHDVYVESGIPALAAV
jgi:hypothetical protein